MTRSTNNQWLHRFAFALGVATLFLVGLGGVVTTKGVGMAVPDWPPTHIMKNLFDKNYKAPSGNTVSSQ